MRPPERPSGPATNKPPRRVVASGFAAGHRTAPAPPRQPLPSITPRSPTQPPRPGHRPPGPRPCSTPPPTPLAFDVFGFSLQYEICDTNILALHDLGGIPLSASDRTLDHPRVIAGGPGAQNPELLAPFIDLFIIGDGEESLPWVMDRWMTLKDRGGMSRADMIAEIVGGTTWAYAPMFYEPEYHADGTIAAMNRTRSDVP